MQITGMNGGGGVGGVGGGNGQIPPQQSQQLQNLTGMSENGVNALVDSYAEENNMSKSDAANELINQLQNSSQAEQAGSTGGAEGSGGLGEDANQNGIPDFIEKLVEEGKLSPEDAAQLMEQMGVPADKAQSFLESVGGSQGGTGTGGGTGGGGGMDFSQGPIAPFQY